MRYLLAAALILLMPFTTLATSLPNLKGKDARVKGWALCDNGGTKLIKYEGPTKNDWMVIKISATSGNAFYLMEDVSGNDFNFFQTGRNAPKMVSLKDLKTKLQSEAPNFHNYFFYAGPHDCSFDD